MQRIFAADIGGTNCRFASFSLVEGRLNLERVVWIKSAGLLDTDMVLTALERELETPLRAADALVLALAGPVQGGLRGKLTNGALRVDFTGLERRYGVARRAGQVHAIVGAPVLHGIVEHQLVTTESLQGCPSPRRCERGRLHRLRACRRGGRG